MGTGRSSKPGAPRGSVSHEATTASLGVWGWFDPAHVRQDTDQPEGERVKASPVRVVCKTPTPS